VDKIYYCSGIFFQQINNGGTVANSIPSDKKCPFTGLVSIRGRILTGTVVSTKMHRTLIIRREYLHFIPKYSRYEKRHKNLAAHVSPAFRVEDGDQVTVGQCRPLSKTVCCVLIFKARLLLCSDTNSYNRSASTFSACSQEQASRSSSSASSKSGVISSVQIHGMHGWLAWGYKRLLACSIESNVAKTERAAMVCDSPSYYLWFISDTGVIMYMNSL
jgi:ribosomal protein uS17